MTCRICGVTPDDPEVHAAWHASLPVTPATREHERRVRVDEQVPAHEYNWRGMRGDG